MWKIFPLVPSKNLWPEETEIAKCLVFKFLMIKFTVISERDIFPLGNLAKLVFWSILSHKNWKVNTLCFLWSDVFLREQEEIFSTYSGSSTLLNHQIYWLELFMPFFPGICGVQSQAVWTTALMSSSTLRLLVRELLQNKYFYLVAKLCYK